MERELLILIDHAPVAWSRPGQGRFGRYDTQRRIKDHLGTIITWQLNKQKPLEGSIHLRAEFYMPEPKSLPQLKSGGYHTKKPDIDNMLKFYLDLCQECRCFKNDSQVCDVTMQKVYGGKNPRVILRFKEIA